MSKLLFVYLARRLAVSALLIEVCLCLPVVMTSIFHYLPPTALRAGLLWPALLGTMPTVLYIALPIAVGVAVMLEFIRMSAEGMIAVLYSLRLSVWSICLPAASVGAAAVVAGYALSCWISPNYVGEMHDVIFVIRSSLNHRLLEPAHFYTFDQGKRTLYFEHWRTPDIATNIFINQIDTEKKQEQIITAAEAEFRRNETGVVLILKDGAIEIRTQGTGKIHPAGFEEYVMPIDMQGNGGMPARMWRGVFELPGSSFLSDFPREVGDPHKLSDWTSEAAKRFGLPILSLVHALFGIALVLTVSSATGRGSTATTLTVLAVPLVHIGLLIGMETLVRKDPRLVGLIALAILVEFAVALALLHRQNRAHAVVRSQTARLETAPAGA